MDRQGKMKGSTWVIIGILVVGFLAATGTIDLSGILGGGQEEEAGPEVTIPSDKQTTVTLKYLDELATSTTSVNATWIAFNGQGEYFNDGQAGSDGKDTFTGEVQSSYTVYSYNSQDENNDGYLAKETSLSTGTSPRETETIKLVKRSGMKNEGFIDPVDLNANITASAGSSSEVRLKWKANVSNAGVRKPAIVLESNSTSVVEDITVESGQGYSEVSCPDRLTPSTAAHKLRCYQSDSDVYASSGLQQVDFSAKFKKGGGITSSDWFEGWLIDEALWLKPGYTSTEDVMYGFEDRDDADVGATDSGKDKVFFSD